MIPRLTRPLLLAVAVLMGEAHAARADEYPHLKFGNPSKAKDDREGEKNNFLMKKEFFALSYNDAKGTANWVSWRVQKSDLGDAKRATFFPDMELPRGFHRVTPKDYTASGFDRGHLCPHRDRASSPKASHATFVMSNMIPQAPNVNQGAWADLEDYLRRVVREGHVLYIVAGPAGKGGVGKNGKAETIAGGKVTVPESCWKVAIVLPEGEDKDDIDKVFARTRVIAVIMPNNDEVKHDWPKYRTSIKKVQELTGYKFFDQVPAETLEKLQEKVDEVQIKQPRRKKPDEKDSDK